MRWSKLQSKSFCVSQDTVKESPIGCLRSDQGNFFDAIDFIQTDGNLFRLGCRDVLADIIRLDRQFAVPSVDQDRDRDPFRSPEIHYRIHASPDRAGGEQDVINQYDMLTGNRKRNVRFMQHRVFVRVAVHIIAVQRDVQFPDRQIDPLKIFDPLGNALGQVYAARFDAHQNEVLSAIVFFQYLMRDAGQRAFHRLGIHDFDFFCHLHYSFIIKIKKYPYAFWA